MGDGRAFREARDFLLKHRTDYETAYRDFQWPQLPEFNWALDYFDPMAAGNTGTALWVLDESGREVRFTFDEMSVRSNRVANWLRMAGVRKADRILLMLGNHPVLWDVLLAACKLGAVIIPATTLLGPQDLQDRLHRGEVRHVIAAPADAPKFDGLDGAFSLICASGSTPGWLCLEDAYGLPASFTPDAPTLSSDPLLLYFTSGTTAQPKLVRHTHRSYPVGHLSTMYWLGLQPGDVHWNISSPGWAKHAWSNFFAPWTAQATVFVFNYRRFQAKQVLRVLEQKPVTTLCAPPTVWRMLVQEDLASYKVRLRDAIAAGEPLNPEVIERVRAAWDVDVRDGYGQTETTALVGNSPGQPLKPGSMGRPLPGYRIELLDPAGRAALDGEVCVVLSPRPAGLMEGYAGDSGRNAESMRGGHYRTGDLAVMDPDGYLTYIGRADDVFKAADYRISPFELESALLQHPAVAEAAVIPSPDPLRLAVPKAVVVLAPGYVPCREVALSLFQFIRRTLAPYKRVRRLEFADLPKTVSGKIRRAELRKPELARGSRDRRDAEFFEEDFPELN